MNTDNQHGSDAVRTGHVQPDPDLAAGCARTARTRNQRGEGIISTAIAVLIVALLGVAMWTGFSAMMTDATDKTSSQIEQIGG
jgi:type VI protein secretion system component VasF